MLTNIKLEKIAVANGVLNNKTYVPIDITKQLEMPILDTQQLDGVLDTTQISLLNYDPVPLEPLTRMILTLTEADGGDTETEYIYRLVENDIVTNVSGGSIPIYRHSISLIEITKMLERVAVDNLTFTNYLDDKYGTDSAIKFLYDYNDVKNIEMGSSTLLAIQVMGYYGVKMEYIKYAQNSNYFMGPYRILNKSSYKMVASDENGALLVVADDIPTEVSDEIDENQIFNPLTQIRLRDVLPTLDSAIVGDYVRFYDATQDNTINTNVNCEIKFTYFITKLFKIFGWFKQTAYANLYSFYVELPNGQRQNLSTSGSFTFTQTGSHIFHQIYTWVSCEFDVHWEITVVDSLKNLPQKYTITEVINRLLSVCSLRREGIDTPRFCLDISVADRLSKILSPEFSFTQGTLFEALQQIGDYIHAIPRLIPSIHYDYDYGENNEIINSERDDYTHWNTITFDFLGGTEQAPNGGYSIIDAQQPMDDFATNFVSNVQNATQSNYDGNTTITEPFIGGFLSTRTESANFEVSNNDCVFKTRKRIRSLISVKIFCNDKIKDITAYVVEKAKFQTKSVYTDGDAYSSKAFYLYYTEGEKNIYNLGYHRENQTFSKSFINEEAIKNILKIDSDINVEDYIKNLSVQIEYIPYQDFKARQYKTFISPTAEESSLFYNQQSNEVDVDAYGESINFALLKTGNKKISKTQYFKSLLNIPKCGQVLDEYYCFMINREIYFNTPIKTTSSWTKDYNELFAFNGVKKNIRQYEISEKECINRNPDYQEFCIIDTQFDMTDIFSDPELQEMQTNIISQLSKLGFATIKNLTQIANKIKNASESDTPISYAIIKTNCPARDGTKETHCFLIPTACFPFGKSIILSFSMDDNYSAGTYVRNANNLDSGNADLLNSYALENYIRYGNEFGRFDTMSVVFGSQSPLINFNNNIKENSKTLYLVDENNINNNSTIVDFNENPFIVDKDSREQIALTIQLNFVTHNKKILIGSAMAHTTPLTTGNNNSFKFVLFHTKPNKFNEYIDISTITNLGSPITTIDNNKKFIKIEPMVACASAVGYGIIDGNNRLCVYVDTHIENNSATEPIYLMFRGKK